ncbi:Glutaredoxin-like protein (Fragment) [Madurella fahalii]|uniref:Glutaredoxin-like protein n=1 Tax=Madurella fahalii TaxID=1157608 RepID=A0ABQ0G0A1_9PEZI
MRATSRLLQSCRITLFTRENCGLCSQARSVLSDVWDKRPFAFTQVDIIKPEWRAWRDLYEFDVPVIHISKAQSPEEDPGLSSKAIKLMHRFTADEVEAKMDAAERG